MNKIRTFLFAAIALFAATSCQEQIADPTPENTEKEVMTITATVGAETKTVLGGDKGVSTFWLENDKISVFDAKYGDNNRCFTVVTEEGTEFPAQTATFACEEDFVMPADQTQEQALIVALYPYQENAYCDFFDPADGKNVITGLNLPSEQVAVVDNFDPRATFTLATDKYTNKDNLSFNNIYTLLRITLKEEGIKKVTVTMEGEDIAIAGDAHIVLNREIVEDSPVFNGGTFVATGTNVVTLTCEEGFVPGEKYYIAVAPVTYTKLEVALDGKVVKTSVPQEPKTLLANNIYNISNLDNPQTVADGVYLNDEGVYEISSEAGLFWLAEQVNTGANTFAGKTVKLTEDVTLTKDWTPMGCSEKWGDNKSFRGKFDGGDHTITDMVVNTAEFAGFIGVKHGSTADAGVYNLKFDNATVKGNHYAAVVVAWADGAQTNYRQTVQNCHVTNSTVTLAAEQIGEKWDNGDKAGAIVGYAYAITVTENTVSHTTITGYRDLGGIVGCAINNEGASDRSNAIVTENTVGEGVKVEVDNTHNYKNFTSVTQHNVGHHVGRNESKITGLANVITDNEGEATFTLPEYIVAVDRGLKFSQAEVTVTYDQPFTAPELEGETEGVVYESSDKTVAEVDGEGNVTIHKAGTVTITASAPETETLFAGEASYTLTVNKADRTVSFTQSSVEVTYGDPFTGQTLADVTGVTYEVTGDAATVNPTTGAVTMVKAGTVTIKATVAETDTHNAATAEYTLTVKRAERNLAFAQESGTATLGKNFTLPSLTGEGNLTNAKYVVASGNAATVTATGEVTLVKSGTVTIKATIAADDTHLEGTATYTLTVKKVLYLVPNANWKQASARFAAYFFGAGEKWVDMTDDNSDGIYEVIVPDGGYTTVIFCRMNPSAKENGWSNKWSQTGDMTIGDKLYCVIPELIWEGSTIWSDNTSLPFIKSGEYYLFPNDDWKKDNAVFAAYFCNGTSNAKWVGMEAVDGAPGYFKVAKPSGENHKNIIFVRMKSTNYDWSNKHNQTSDLTFGSGNLYEITGWDNSGKWHTLK